MRTSRLLTIFAILGALGHLAAARPQAGRAGQSRDAVEAAAAFERAMVLFRQGAFAEAEREFRTAEKRTGENNADYVLAAAENYLELHRADEARRRFERVYKKDPANTRALVGLAASFEEAQNYREAVRMWQRYARMELPASEKAEADAALRGAQELLVTRYEVGEKIGAEASATEASPDEKAWGLGMARELAASGVPLVSDATVNDYVRSLCATLASRAKGFPVRHEVFVLDGPSIYAIAAPGYVFVFRGLLEAMDTESALAGALAHEMAHAAAGHVVRVRSRAANQQQQLEDYRKSDTAWARLMVKLLEAGNPYGQIRFTKDDESQADRLAVHFAYDAGFDPLGITRLLQRQETLPAGSRGAWEMLMAAHPFSPQRAVAVREHAALLPAKAVGPASAGFARMRARLAALPQPREARAPKGPAPGAEGVPGAAGVRPDPPAGIPYSLDDAPFAGEIPKGWTARRSEAGTIVFEGEKGTDAYQATVELQVAPASGLRGLTLDDMTARVVANLSKRKGAEVRAPVADRTADGFPVRRVAATFSMEGEGGRLIPARHVSGVVEYPGWFVVLSYFASAGAFERFLGEADFIGGRLRFTGK